MVFICKLEYVNINMNLNKKKKMETLFTLLSESLLSYCDNNRRAMALLVARSSLLLSLSSFLSNLYQYMVTRWFIMLFQLTDCTQTDCAMFT